MICASDEAAGVRNGWQVTKTIWICERFWSVWCDRSWTIRLNLTVSYNSINIFRNFSFFDEHFSYMTQSRGPLYFLRGAFVNHYKDYWWRVFFEGNAVLSDFRTMTKIHSEASEELFLSSQIRVRGNTATVFNSVNYFKIFVELYRDPCSSWSKSKN